MYGKLTHTNKGPDGIRGEGFLINLMETMGRF